MPPNRELVEPNAFVVAGAAGWPNTDVVAGAFVAGCPNADVVPPPNALGVPPNAPKPPAGFAPKAPPVLPVFALLKAPIDQSIIGVPKGKQKDVPKPPVFVLAGVARPPNIGLT